MPRAPARPSRPGGPTTAGRAPTCSPLSPGHDVFPELPRRPVPGHLLVPCQALRQQDLGGQLHPRNHGERLTEPRGPSAARLRSRLGACRDVTRPRRPRPNAPVTSYACEGPAVTARHRRLAAGPREDSTRPGRSGEVRGLQFHPTADGGRCGAEQDAEDGEDPAPPGLFPSGGVIRKGREGERKGFAGAAAATQAPCRRRRRPSRAAPAPHAASGLQPGCQGRRKPARCPRGHSPPGRTERDTTVLSAE